MRRALLVLLVLPAIAAGCGGGDGGFALDPGLPVLTVTSEAFAPGSPIPVEFTCDGADRSLPLAWSAPPPGTRSIAIVMDDPDAPGGRFTHWVVANLPLTPPRVEAGASGTVLRELAVTEGKNGFGKVGYGGPCPPRSHGPHTYVIAVYALDTVLSFDGPPSKGDLYEVMESHVLGAGELRGTYDR